MNDSADTNGLFRAGSLDLTTSSRPDQCSASGRRLRVMHGERSARKTPRRRSLPLVSAVEGLRAISPIMCAMWTCCGFAFLLLLLRPFSTAWDPIVTPRSHGTAPRGARGAGARRIAAPAPRSGLGGLAHLPRGPPGAAVHALPGTRCSSVPISAASLRNLTAGTVVPVRVCWSFRTPEDVWGQAEGALAISDVLVRFVCVATREAPLAWPVLPLCR